MEPSLGATIATTKNVSDILNTLITQSQNPNLSVQELHREVVDFQNALQRMSDVRFTPEIQLDNDGTIRRGIQQQIPMYNKRLGQLEELLYRSIKTPTTRGLMLSKLVKRFRLNSAEGDVQFYQTKIKNYKVDINLRLQMLSVMYTLYTLDTSSTVASTTENEIRRLEKIIGDVQLSEEATTSADQYSLPGNTPLSSNEGGHYDNQADNMDNAILISQDLISSTTSDERHRFEASLTKLTKSLVRQDSHASLQSLVTIASGSSRWLVPWFPNFESSVNNSRNGSTTTVVAYPKRNPMRLQLVAHTSIETTTGLKGVPCFPPGFQGH